jgi:hypothetical protein
VKRRRRTWLCNASCSRNGRWKGGKLRTEDGEKGVQLGEGLVLRDDGRQRWIRELRRGGGSRSRMATKSNGGGSKRSGKERRRTRDGRRISRAGVGPVDLSWTILPFTSIAV